MAVYNGERYLAEAIESVLRQTHKDFEFLIVDDGSTDRTREIIDGYAVHDERLVVVSQANADQPAALNRALADAKNDWVAVLDADDVCMPHRLETQLSALSERPHARVLGSYAVNIDEMGTEIGVRAQGPTTLAEFSQIVARDDLLYLVHPSVLVHRQTILSLGGYDVAFGAAADTELWSRVADEHVVLSLPLPLIYYRIHPDRMSITRFFEQQLMLRWMKVRQTARRTGAAPPTLQEYQDACGSRLSLLRLGHARQDWGQYFMKRSRMSWQGGDRPRALMFRAAALMLRPFAALPRFEGTADT